MAEFKDDSLNQRYEAKHKYNNWADADSVRTSGALLAFIGVVLMPKCVCVFISSSGERKRSALSYKSSNAFCFVFFNQVWQIQGCSKHEQLCEITTNRKPFSTKVGSWTPNVGVTAPTGSEAGRFLWKPSSQNHSSAMLTSVSSIWWVPLNVWSSKTKLWDPQPAPACSPPVPEKPALLNYFPTVLMMNIHVCIYDYICV